MECPTCNLQDTTKNEFIHNRKQRYVCKDCGRQFVENPPNKRIPQQLWYMVDKLLLEKIPIAGISRVTEISEPWLQQYINQKYEHVPQQSHQSTVNVPFVTLIFVSAYEQVLPQNRHRAVAKESGNWNFIHYYNAEISPKLAITTY